MAKDKDQDQEKDQTQTKDVASKDQNPERKKAIETALSQITKQFGDGSIMRMTGNEIKHVEVIPTGAISLDIALGVGGIPKERIIEIYGPESSGKTSLTLHIAAEPKRKAE